MSEGGGLKPFVRGEQRGRIFMGNFGSDDALNITSARKHARISAGANYAGCVSRIA
jgi:hypothetical protein